MNIRVVANDLKPAAGEEDFRWHCAALEWSLAEPIIINSGEDLRSRVDWKDRVDPFHHQVQNLMRFCRRLPVTLLADDVGLGKTISAGLIIAELMKRNRVSKVFVICPKILIPQWVEELGAKFGISAYGAVGAELRAAHQRTEPVIVTTYQSATGFLESPEAAGRFDMLILDEAHKVRNLHGGQAPPRMATAIFKALESRMFKYVVMLTATPIQNRLWDIYSLVDCLAVARGHKNPFGTPAQFGSRFIADSVTTARRLNQQHADEFRSIVNSYMFRTRRVDAQLAFPDRQVRPHEIEPTQGENQLQRIIASNIAGFNGLAQISLLVALMSSPHALAAQLENMASSGTADRRLAAEVRGIVRTIAMPAKAKAVISIANRLRSERHDWRMVVFTTRKETQKMLGEVLSDEGIPFGFIAGGSPASNLATVNAFRQESPSINVIVSTDAGAEGVNLQAGNILVNYDLPWNPMIVEQRIGRIQRIGSKFKNVFVVNVVHKNSPEQQIVGRLIEKLQVISHTVGDIEAVLEAAGDSGGESFERQIRDMVIKSLRGQDQEAAAKAAVESIEKARKLIEQHQEEMDQTLGKPRGTDEAEIPMPRLEPALPSVPLHEFVIGALRSEGATVNPKVDGLYSCRSNMHDEDFTFDQQVLERFTQRGVFMGRAPLLYQQGKPAFERLVQRWIDRSGARIDDRRCSVRDADAIARQWVDTVPTAEFVSVKTFGRSQKFIGHVVCRTRVANAVDSYEKLIKLPYQTLNQVPSASADLSRAIDAKELLPDLEQCVVSTVNSDPDICKFRGFYEARLNAELARSDAGDRKAKLVNDLGPGITSEASAVQGTMTDTVMLGVTYKFGGTETYYSELQVDGGELKASPRRGKCEFTQLDLPVDCLEKCRVTSRMALREKLSKSEASGEYAWPDSFVTCEATGKQVHKEETHACSITGKVAWTGAMDRSEVSGRYALLENVLTCEITGSRILCDEVALSVISGKRFRFDQTQKLTSGEMAHTSEAVQCGYTGDWLPRSQCDVSNVTGKAVSKARLAFSEYSNRKCDISELVRCDGTGQRLLPDEVGQCEKSNKRLRKDLLSQCPETGKSVDKTILVACEETGVPTLPEALDACCVTGKRVRGSLLGASAASGKKCLANKLVRCEKTLVKLLPDEVHSCDVTGQRVDRRLLQKCGASGKIALSEKMVQSQASGKWILTEFTKTLPNGAVVGAKEVAACTWTRRYLRAEETAVCSLSGLTFAKNLLNASGELSVLRECLEGKHRGETFPEPGYLARVQPKVFSGISVFKWVSSPSNNAHVMFGKKSTFGFNAHFFAVVAIGDLHGLVLVGNALFGKRINGIWQPTGTFPMRAEKP